MACPHGCCPTYRDHVATVGIAPSATPSRHNNAAPRTPNPAWERGIATDERGMPYLKPGSMEFMSVKEAAERRREIEGARRALRQAPAATTPERG